LTSLPETIAYKNHGGMYSLVGLSDITAVIKGRAIFIEVKAPGKESTLSIPQLKFLQKATEAGAIAFMATSIEGVKQRLKELL